MKGPPDCREEIKCGKSFEMWVVMPALMDFGGIPSHFFSFWCPVFSFLQFVSCLSYHVRLKRDHTVQTVLTGNRARLKKKSTIL